MEATIRLDCGDWYINDEYRIEGDTEVGYSIYKVDDIDNEEVLYEDNDFESCIMWAINS